MTSTWTKLVNLVIRPPRATYDPDRHLPGPRFRIGGVSCAREDVEVVGALGLKLRCSHYKREAFDKNKNEPAPCVVYLHGNSGSRCDATDAVRLLLPIGIDVFALDFGGSGLSEGTHVSLGTCWCCAFPGIRTTTACASDTDTFRAPPQVRGRKRTSPTSCRTSARETLLAK